MVSSAVVCPQNTNFLSGQTVTVPVNSSHWHYFIINMFKPDSTVEVSIKVNSTAWLYKGKGMYCPNHAWIFPYKRLRSWWKTSFKVHSTSLDLFHNDLARIQTFGIFTKNDTLVTINVSEETIDGPSVPPFHYLTTILIFITFALLGKYLHTKYSK